MLNVKKFDRLEISEKNLSLPKAPWPKQENSGTPMFWVDGTTMVFCVFIFFFFFFFFCLEATLEKDT